MKKSTYILFSLSLLCSTLFAQATIPMQALQDNLLEIISEQGNILFPKQIAQLQSEVLALEKKTAQAGPGDDRDEYLRIEKELHHWLATSVETSAFLTELLSVRAAAVALQAESFADDLFARAEKRLQRAAELIARGNLDRANKPIDEARLLYRRAELEAVRNNLLGEIRILIHESLDLNADELAPQAYQETRQRLAEMEKLVSANLASEENVSQKSRELVQAANLLLKRVQVIHPLYKSRSRMEAFMTAFETELSALALELHASPAPQSSYTKTLQELREVAQALNREKEQLLERNQELEEQLGNLEQEIAQYRSEADARRELQTRINTAKALLKQPVMQDGNKLLIQLDSLVFSRDKSDLSADQRRMLGRLCGILQPLRCSKISTRVISYTAEDPAFHQDLANRRAAAVANYLQHNLALSGEQVNSQGVAHLSLDTLPLPEMRIELTIQAETNTAQSVILTGRQQNGRRGFSE